MEQGLMHEFLGLIFNLLIPIGILLLGLQVIKNLVPGPYRYAERFGKTIVRYMWSNQAKKRGWLFASLVHFPLMFSVALFIVGIVTATVQLILIGIALAILALLAKRGLASLKRLSRRRSLPSWRH
jgi:hypothetical protein